MTIHLLENPAPAIPRGLRGKARQFFQTVVRDFALEPFHIELLTQGCWALQRCEEARAVVDREGLTYLDAKTGRVFPHPCVVIEKDNRILFSRVLRELGLDLAESQIARPPTRSG
jgi:hypothetical protein